MTSESRVKSFLPLRTGSRGVRGPIHLRFRRRVDSLLLAAAFARARPGPVVRVVEIAARGVEQVGRLLEGEQAVPVGLGIAAIDGFGEVELWIATGNEVAVPVGDVTVGIGKDGVVGGVGLHLHRFGVFHIIPCLGAEVGLFEGLDGFLHELDRDPLPIFQRE